jgi:transposase
MQHRQKALHQRHVPLTHVLTDLTGATGLAIIRAMVAGARDPVQLARFRAPRGASRPEEIAKALPGHDQREPVLALTRALALDDAYTDQVRECAGAIARRFQAITPVWSAELPPLDRADTHPTHHKHAPTDEARRLRSQVVGVDLSAIPGLHASPVHTMLSAIGLDLHQWPNMKAFGAW